jgi:hypothetical protein
MHTWSSDWKRVIIIRTALFGSLKHVTSREHPFSAMVIWFCAQCPNAQNFIFFLKCRKALHAQALCFTMQLHLCPCLGLLPLRALPSRSILLPLSKGLSGHSRCTTRQLQLSATCRPQLSCAASPLPDFTLCMRALWPHCLPLEPQSTSAHAHPT